MLHCFLYAFLFSARTYGKIRYLTRKNLTQTVENAPIDERAISLQLLSYSYFFIKRKRLSCWRLGLVSLAAYRWCWWRGRGQRRTYFFIKRKRHSCWRLGLVGLVSYKWYWWRGRGQRGTYFFIKTKRHSCWRLGLVSLAAYRWCWWRGRRQRGT